MASDRKKRSALVLAVCVLMGTVVPARSCGPDLFEAIFVRPTTPDDPEAFAAGSLGILLPTHYQRYLYLAYRNLSGHPLSAEDRAQALALPPTSFGEGQSGLQRWRALRDSLLAEGRRDYIMLDCARQKGDAYYYYPNYYDDAFRNAAATLADRVQRQRSVDAAVRDWILAQDRVFDACGQDSTPPPEPPTGSPDWLIQDRAYQRAAWEFYAGHFDRAAERFRAIASEKASPWHGVALYLVARSLVRKAMVTPGYREPDMAALSTAEKEIERLLADREQAPMHPALQRLLEFVRFRLYPEKRLAQLGHSLLEAHPGPDLSQQVFDLTVLLDRIGTARAESLAATSADYELADWILTFQNQDHPHALARWRATKASPWLVSAITSAARGAPEVPELLSAASKVSPGDPAFASLTFHRARLSSADEVRKVLDGLPRDPFPNSSWNIVQALRMRLARDFEDFLTHASRVPSDFRGYDYSSDTAKANPDAPLLDSDGALILNRWAPLAAGARAAVSPKLGKEIRDRVALSQWPRAALLDDAAIATQLAAPVASAYPALAPYLRAYGAAADGPARRFEATWMFLHAPGTSPWLRWGVGRLSPLMERDVYRDNWWCVERPNEQAWFLGYVGAPEEQAPETWTHPKDWDTQTASAIFTSEERARAGRERSGLTSLGAGANFMCEQTIAWAKSHPGDARLAEALYLCVQATRYGCTDPQTTQWSKRAFSFLHSRYPGTEWAKKTKYWY